MDMLGLSSQSCIFGSRLTFLLSDGQRLGKRGAKTLCKRICWWLGGIHGGGGCSRLLREVCGAHTKDAALGKSMLIPLSLLQRQHCLGRLRAMVWAPAKGVQV